MPSLFSTFSLGGHILTLIMLFFLQTFGTALVELSSETAKHFSESTALCQVSILLGAGGMDGSGFNDFWKEP